MNQNKDKHRQGPGGGVVGSPLSCDANERLSAVAMALQRCFPETSCAFTTLFYLPCSQACSKLYNT